MNATNYIVLNPGRTSAMTQPRKARVADSRIPSAAQRSPVPFAYGEATGHVAKEGFRTHRAPSEVAPLLSGFGARTAPVAQRQKYGGVQDFVTLAVLANKN